MIMNHLKINLKDLTQLFISDECIMNENHFHQY